MASGLVSLSIVLAGCGSSDGAEVEETPVPDVSDETPSATTTDNSTPPATAEQDAPPAAVAIAAAAATAGDTFDEAFYDPNAGNFPALDDPEMVAASSASWLDPGDIVMGIVSESGEAMAFPVDQMAYHHVANTRLAGEPFVVTY